VQACHGWLLADAAETLRPVLHKPEGFVAVAIASCLLILPDFLTEDYQMYFER
jgi:hypothetical protein